MTEGVRDEMALSELNATIDAKVSRVLADGAFDSRNVLASQTDAFGSQAEVINPPAVNCAIGLQDAGEALLKSFAQIGRLDWRTATGQNDRAPLAAQTGRWKQVIGDTIKSHKI